MQRFVTMGHEWIAMLCVVIVAACYGKKLLVPPETNAEEMNHLLSVDEGALLEAALRQNPGNPAALCDFSVIGNSLQCHYRCYCNGTALIEDVTVTRLETKAYLTIRFRNQNLFYIEYRPSLISVPEVYQEEEMGAQHHWLMAPKHLSFLADHALALMQRIANVNRKTLEAQLV